MRQKTCPGSLTSAFMNAVSFHYTAYKASSYHLKLIPSSVERGLFKDFNQEFPPWISESAATDHIWSILKIMASVSPFPL